MTLLRKKTWCVHFQFGIPPKIDFLPKWHHLDGWIHGEKMQEMSSVCEYLIKDLNIDIIDMEWYGMIWMNKNEPFVGPFGLALEKLLNDLTHQLVTYDIPIWNSDKLLVIHNQIKSHMSKCWTACGLNPLKPPPKKSKIPRNITWNSVTVGMAIGHRMTIGRRMTVAGYGRVQRTQLQHDAMGRPTWAEKSSSAEAWGTRGRADFTVIFLEIIMVWIILN